MPSTMPRPMALTGITVQTMQILNDRLHVVLSLHNTAYPSISNYTFIISIRILAAIRITIRRHTQVFASVCRPERIGTGSAWTRTQTLQEISRRAADSMHLCHKYVKYENILHIIIIYICSTNKHILSWIKMSMMLTTAKPTENFQYD